MIPSETAVSPQLPIQPPSVTLKTSSTSHLTTYLLVIALFILLGSLSVNFLQFQGFFVNRYLGYSVYRLPISPQAQYIKNVGINYYLETKIVEIKTTPGKTELITAIDENNLPKFLITDKTNIYIRQGGQIEASTLEKLQSGQKVGIILQFTLISQPTISRILIDP